MLFAIEFLLMSFVLLASTFLSTSGLALVHDGSVFEINPAAMACAANLIAVGCFAVARRRVDAATVAMGAVFAFALLAAWRSGFRFGSLMFFLTTISMAPVLRLDLLVRAQEWSKVGVRLGLALVVGWLGASLIRRFCFSTVELRWVACSMVALVVLSSKLLFGARSADQENPELQLVNSLKHDASMGQESSTRVNETMGEIPVLDSPTSNPIGQ